jgi:predicted DNA-binding transcriptional regulator AlpA
MPRRDTPTDAPTHPPTDRLIGVPIVRDRLGRICRSTLWRLVQRGEVPPPVRLGTRSLWSEREIDAIIARRLAERGQP